MPTVHNLNGTSGRTPPAGCESWLDFWRKKTGKKGKTCKNIVCKNDATLGAHVQKDGSGVNKDWYITPLCSACNNKPSSQTFFVSMDHLEPVNP